MRVLCLIAVCAAAFGGPPRQQAVKLSHVAVPMRDGVRLYANVFLPSEHARVPAVLVRTPYGKGEELAPNWRALLDHGFAVMVEDVRGRYESEGDFAPLTQEPADGDDTLNWIARQPWCDGKIGMTGGSYLGIVQWKVALRANPHLKAIFAVVAGDDDYRDRFYSTGGAMKLGNRLEWMAENLKTPGYHPDFNRFVWHLPLRTADVAATGRVSSMYQEAVAHPAFDGFWRSISTRSHLDQVRVPVFAVGGLYDNFVESDLEAFAALHKRSGLNHLLIGPWPHNMSAKFAGADFGSASAAPVRRLTIEWFDQWLNGKSTAIASAAPVRIFVMGADQWLDAREWPPEHARARSFYLASQGRANTAAGDGALEDRPPRRAGADRFTFDPRDPVPTRGGAVCCNPRVFPWGPMDQRPVEQRRDVLVFTTRPLERDLEVVGPVKAVLWVSTSQRDTDFTAKLVDVFPDGYARNLTDGILRLRYRNSLERAEPALPGEVYQITLDAGIASNEFLKGHRIRVEISSSNFPRFDRNPNTGAPVAGETRLLKANQTIYHDRRHPSRLVLMVM
ncbi:MAG: CocE/NonD family hydrolase [Bryobacteraceae bacterium]